MGARNYVAFPLALSVTGAFPPPHAVVFYVRIEVKYNGRRVQYAHIIERTCEICSSTRHYRDLYNEITLHPRIPILKTVFFAVNFSSPTLDSYSLSSISISRRLEPFQQP